MRLVCALKAGFNRNGLIFKFNLTQAVGYSASLSTLFRVKFVNYLLLYRYNLLSMKGRKQKESTDVIDATIKIYMIKIYIYELIHKVEKSIHL